METCLTAIGFDVWQSVLDGYTPPQNPPTDTTGKIMCENNAKAKHAILCNLVESEFGKVMHYKSAKDIWDKMKNVYEGADNVKKAKLQTHQSIFESLKMKEDENVAAFLDCIDEVVNSMKALGEEVKEQLLVKKILRSSPMKFNSKVSAIEDRTDLDTLTKDELHGILIAYEMKVRGNESKKKI